MGEEAQATGIGLDNLLSGVVGAIAVAFFTLVYTEIREARQRVRVRMGYTRLLDDEIKANREPLQSIFQASRGPREKLRAAWPETPPTDEAWKAVRVPLTPLIKDEHFRRLEEHYRSLKVLMDMKEHRAAKPDLTVRGVSSDLVDELPELSDMLSRYANPSRRVRTLGF